MKIVIDIPEDRYETLKMLSEKRTFHLDFFQMLVVNGTQLPKGHGRLIDGDAFINAECSQCDGNCGVCDCDCLHCKSEWRCDFIKDIDSADVIIEADKEDDDD